MSMKKKKPGQRWITGLPRAQIGKALRILNSIVKQNIAQPANARPITVQQAADIALTAGDLAALLALLS